MPQRQRIIWPHSRAPGHEAGSVIALGPPAEPESDQSRNSSAGAKADFMDDDGSDLFPWDDIPFRRPVTQEMFGRFLTRRADQASRRFGAAAASISPAGSQPRYSRKK